MIKPSELIVLRHDDDWHEQIRRAGRVVSIVLNTLKDIIENYKPTRVVDGLNCINLLDLEKIASDIISEHCYTPTFLGYKGFPSSICISVNENIVHGIPYDYNILAGDIIKLDLGVTTETGAIADGAITVMACKWNEEPEIIKKCHGALQAGIDAIKVGEHIGVIGHAINKFIKDTRYSLITNYGGHGIETNKPHAPPFVANKQKIDEGIRLQPGMTLAIEPMIVDGSAETKILDDGWTVKTNGISAHFEHTVIINNNGIVEIITL